MADTKELKITGNAVQDYYKQKRGKRSSTRKVKEDTPLTLSSAKSIHIMKGGGDADPGSRQPPIQLSSNPTPATVAVGTAAVPNPKVAEVLPALQAQQQQQQQVPQVPQKGGAKVILQPKKGSGKLLLAPPTGKKPGTRSVHSKGETRKVKVTLSNMKKRLTTAKVIHKDSKEKSIDDIRRLLEEAKLVKPAKEGKKVPEDILRNIYKDYLILRNKAL